MKTLLTALRMMPGGMMPSGWDWGSMWLVMVVPAVAVVAGILLVVVLVLRNERQPSPIQAATHSHTQIQPTITVPGATIQVKYSGTNNEAVGSVVLSLAPTLTDDERRVMDELAMAGGEMLQSSLPEMTGYSKATVSKVIHSLETRGIIVRERHKWTYWCKVNPRLVERFGQPESAASGQVS